MKTSEFPAVIEAGKAAAKQMEYYNKMMNGHLGETSHKDLSTLLVPDLHDLVDVKVLDIPDTHPHMDPELIKSFREQYEDI